MNLYNQQLSTDAANAVEEVIRGEREKFEAFGICPQQISSYFEEKGWECGELDTNGWQYDWWRTFTHGEKSFTASGSGYYGWFEFSPTEE